MALVAITAMLWLEAVALAWTENDAPVTHEGDDAATALALCQQADQQSGDERDRLLERGHQIAERAVAADPQDAAAHFAVFCNLGKRFRSRVGALAHVRRLKHEIDTALTLRPDYPDALAAKGAMLVALPWFFGGDRREGEELLCAALARDPTNAEVRRYLAEAKDGGDDCDGVLARP